MVSRSTIGSASPARCRRPPASRRSTAGATLRPAPPSSSSSARSSASRSSASVAPPGSAARNRPSGFSTRPICSSVPGRSLTQCRLKQDSTRSKRPAANGSSSSSAATLQALRPARHRGREVGLDQRADRRPRAERPGELPGVAAELEREREAAPHVGHALDQPRGHLADQEIDAGQPGRRALAPAPQQPPVEDLRLGRLSGVAHLPYMVRSPSG